MMDSNGFYNIPLKVKSTEKTPSFEYIPRLGTFHVKGVSVPEDPKTFYQPILDWLDGFAETQDVNSYLMVNIDLDYFSTKSLIKLIQIFKKFERFKNTCVNWYYDDNDLKEAGDELASMLNMQFNVINKEA